VGKTWIGRDQSLKNERLKGGYQTEVVGAADPPVPIKGYQLQTSYMKDSNRACHTELRSIAAYDDGMYDHAGTAQGMNRITLNLGATPTDLKRILLSWF